MCREYSLLAKRTGLRHKKLNTSYKYWRRKSGLLGMKQFQEAIRSLYWYVLYRVPFQRTLASEAPLPSAGSMCREGGGWTGGVRHVCGARVLVRPGAAIFVQDRHQKNRKDSEVATSGMPCRAFSMGYPQLIARRMCGAFAVRYLERKW